MAAERAVQSGAGRGQHVPHEPGRAADVLPVGGQVRRRRSGRGHGRLRPDPSWCPGPGCEVARPGRLPALAGPGPAGSGSGRAPGSAVARAQRAARQRVRRRSVRHGSSVERMGQRPGGRTPRRQPRPGILDLPAERCVRQGRLRPPVLATTPGPAERPGLHRRSPSPRSRRSAEGGTLRPDPLPAEGG